MKTIITQEQLTALRHELACLLGDGWTHTPDPDHTWTNTMIKGPQGAAITVSRSSQDGKVIIGGWSENYGETPTYNSSHAIMPTIRVAYQRGAATIYKEITRRFLPKFGQALRAADTYIRERDDYRAKSETTFDAIFAAFTLCQGSKPRHQRNEDGGGMIYAGKVETGSITVRINSAESVEFDVKHLSRVRAVKLAAFLATL